MPRYTQRIQYMKLKKWFPENDTLATQMARLCILREDFLFELQMGVESKLLTKDDYGHTWRLMYFFRRMSNTVEEIRRTIESISGNAEFKRLLQAQNNDFKKSFKQSKVNLKTALDIIKTIRDDAAAHILEKSMHQAIENMDYELSGSLQISFKDPKDTHYRFTAELLTALIFKDTPPQDQERRAVEIIETFLAAIEHLLFSIENIFLAYIHERGLMV